MTATLHAECTACGARLDAAELAPAGLSMWERLGPPACFECGGVMLSVVGGVVQQIESKAIAEANS